MTFTGCFPIPGPTYRSPGSAGGGAGGPSRPPLMVTTLRDQTGTALHHPQGVVEQAGGGIYIADTDGNRILRLVGGVMSVVAGDGTGVGTARRIR